MGVFAAAPYAQAEAEPAPGDGVSLCTDGVGEAVNNADEEFGEERLVRLPAEPPAGGRAPAVAGCDGRRSRLLWWQFFFRSRRRRWTLYSRLTPNVMCNSSPSESDVFTGLRGVIDEPRPSDRGATLRSDTNAGGAVQLMEDNRKIGTRPVRQVTSRRIDQ